MASTQKIVNLGLIFAGAAVFLFLEKLTGAIWSLVRLPRMVDWIATPQAIIAFAIAAGAALIVRRNQKSNQFLNEAVTELSKVTWPPNKETVVSTGISCVLVAICALILFAFDSLWGTITRGLFAS